MKHYIGTIEELNGEQGYSQSFLFTSADPKKDMMEIARTWYGEPDDSQGEDGGFYFLDGHIFAEPGDYREISAEDYATILRVGALPEMQPYKEDV
jgi:hypothetical protein